MSFRIHSGVPVSLASYVHHPKPVKSASDAPAVVSIVEPEIKSSPLPPILLVHHAAPAVMAEKPEDEPIVMKIKKRAK